MTKFCPDCGTPAAGGKFCAECGFRFVDPAAAAPAAATNTNRWQANGSFSQPMGNGNGSFLTPNNVAQAAQVAVPAAAASANRWQANGSFNQPMGNGNGSFLTPNNVAQATQVAAPLAARAASYSAPNATGYGRPQQQQQPVPIAVATPVNGDGAAYGNGANNGGGAAYGNGANYGDPSVYKSPFAAVSPVAATPPPPPPPPAPEPVPTAASGAEAQQVYEQCVQTMRQSRGGNNEDGVKTFKQNCRLYGLKQMDVQAFYDSLVRELGPEATLAFVPTLARLVPDDGRRKELVEYNASKRPPPPAYGTTPFLNRNSSSSSAGSYRDRAGSQAGAPAPASKGLLKGRYADHPNCDVCNVAFDVTKRRHHCRRCNLSICSSCSPLRLLIPQGMQVDGAKGYDPSLPQRVCIQCAPQLHQYQDELVAQFAKANEDNAYTAQGRLIHVPFSSSLFKECQNAADIIGNFFRDDWGAAADRSIPVAFLQKAHGLAVLSIIKVGFLVTGQIGTGLVVAKLPDGSWSAPSAIGLGGLSGGFEIGGELIELMVILGSEGAVKVFHKPQANIGAGLDLAVGPFGRSAEAAAAVSASGLNANYSYSHSKGLFAGISLQGKIIAARSDLNRKFYGRDLQPSEILSGHVAAPNAARPLYEAIQHAMEGADNHRESVQRRSSLMGPCRLCNCPMFVSHTRQVWNKNCKTCKHVH